MQQYGDTVNRMLSATCFRWLIVLILLLINGLLMAEGIEWGGEFESEIYANDRYDEPEIGSINILTLTGEAQVNENASFHSRILFRYFSGYKIVNDVSDVVIDRAHLNLYLPKCDLRIGKQRLAWGSGYAFNPTDVFNPPDYTDPQADPEGVAALQLTVPLGTLSEIMFVGAQSTVKKISHPITSASVNTDTSLEYEKDASDIEVALRGKTNIGGFDLSLIAIDLGEDEAEKIGGSLNGELFYLGVWCEGAYTYVEDELEALYDEADYWQLTAGTDFTFANGLYLVGEYYRNGQGQWSVDDYQWSRQREGRLSNLGQDYFFGNGSYDVTDLINTSLGGLVNINDGSFFFHPAVNYAVYSDTMAAAGVHGFYGSEKSEFYGQKNSKNYRLFNEYYLRFTVNF